MKSTQKKDLARLLYTQNDLTQEEIAERVGVSRKTIGLWVKEGKWEMLKTSLTITREAQIAALYEGCTQPNNKRLRRPEGERGWTDREADAIAKISKSISSMQTECGIVEITSVFSSFLSWLRQHDVEETQRLAPLFDAYIKTKL